MKRVRLSRRFGVDQAQPTLRRRAAPHSLAWATRQAYRTWAIRYRSSVVRLGTMAALIAFAGQAGASDVQTAVDVVITSPPSPVGAGARATGVGSAFIALADDATAASWNPGGLVQLERPELSVVGVGSLQSDAYGSFSRSTDTFQSTFEVGKQRTTSLGVNFASVAVPFAVRGRNVVFSANYQQMLEFNRAIDYTRTNLVGNDSDTGEIRFRQDGGVAAFSPAFAIELMPGLSVGTAFNYWFDEIGRSYAWQRRFDIRVVNPDPDDLPGFRTWVTSDHFRGVNGTFGTLWRPSRLLAVGAVVELPVYARFDLHRATDQTAGESVYPRLRLDLPASYGLGISLRPIDKLVIAADATMVEWGQFRVHDNVGNEFLVSGLPASNGTVAPVWTARLGFEWVEPTPIALIAVRLGTFYDPEPSSGSPQDFYGASLGLGFSSSSLSLDFAYQVRFGIGVSQVSVLDSLFGTPEQSIDVFQHRLYSSLVYYF